MVATRFAGRISFSWIVAAATTSLVLIALLSSSAYAITDDKSKQKDADIATAADKPIGKNFAACKSAGGGATGWQRCIVDSCVKYESLQYQDRCFAQLWYETTNDACMRKLSADFKYTQGYGDCVGRARQVCNSVDAQAYKGANAKDYCLRSLAFYSSPWANPNHPSYNKPGTPDRLNIYGDFGPFTRGELTGGKLKEFTDKLNGIAESTDPGGGKDKDKGKDKEGALLCDLDDSGAIDTDGEKACVKKNFDSAEVVPQNLQCSTSSGAKGVKISTPIGGTKCIEASQDGGIDDNPIINIMRIILKVASAGVGLVVALMIIIAGIQYSTSQGNPQRTVAAKQRLINAIIGLIMFIFATAILNFVVPGGLIGGV